ncbi:amino acid adenylation domain-containing protein [Flavobacterium eburneipallidum]|uniref:amino acid adenylation domain-containing protein n=1 Tax=Flavobacterium eburneipallidum TaxID=3003263 RepID=UPI0024830319|nr:amino acid adenylation domain-containing protein [Flavobacterium eburneipallidum]
MTKENDNLENEIKGIQMTYPKSTLHELFAERATQFPDAIAVEFDDKQVTYGQLAQQINQMANYFWSEGLRPGQIVAISLDRTPELIASMFAVLQCGASYIPIDTLYPEARINLMMEDAGATLYIGSKSKETFSDTITSLSIETILKAIVDFPNEALTIKTTPESGAYIIYTSGSTGKPKGVHVAHCNVINLVYSMAIEPGIGATDKIFALTTISFDAMVMEIYLPLLFGACVVIVDEDTRLDGQLLLQKAIKNNISVIWGTPSIWQILLDSGWEKPLNIKILIGGEPVPLPLAHKLSSRCNELWNIYGPTETTVCSFLTQITVNDNPITIGKPIANTTVYLLDVNKNPVKQGEVGEIVIAGDGVSLGYLNRPELTNERFVPDNFDKESNGKMYLSGDLGKLLPNGQVQCLGRIDNQVKVRGYRIEIGEIENTLQSIKGIKSSVVLANSDILIAFVIADFEISQEQDQIKLWKNELAAHLPPFMIPNVFHIIDKIPTTPNGKVDKAKLLEFKSLSDKNQTLTAPRTEEEKLVAAIWKESLNLKEIDIFSDFFEIGGHSVKAVKVIIDTEKHTGKRFPLSVLFAHSTVEKFAKLISNSEEIDSSCIVALKPNGTKVPFFMIHGGGLNVLNYINLSKHFDEDQPFYAIQGVGDNGFDNWYKSIDEMAADYVASIVKINPTGPYAIGGFCVGGFVAFEVVRQLKAQGKEVSLTALLDSYADSSYYCKTYNQKKRARKYQQTYKRLVFLKDMLTSWESFKKRFNSKRDYILKKHLEQNNTMTEQEILAQQRFAEASGKILNLLDAYHLKPQNIDVEIFRSKNRVDHQFAPPHLGWKKAALKGLTVHTIPSDNFDIRVAPNDKILARMFQDILDKKHLNIKS